MSITMISRLTIDQLCSRKTDLLMSSEDIQKVTDIAKDRAIRDFAEWCYDNGIDFSYMSKQENTGYKFINNVIDRFCEDW